MVVIFKPVNTSASGMLGVIKLTLDKNLFFKIFIALSSINFFPPFATITGSSIIFLALIFLSDFITDFITLSECNIPIFTASGLISLAVNSTWLEISLLLIGSIDLTPVVF